jgi:hypothetical protein
VSDVIDHKIQAQSRIYAQYRDKPKFVAWIGINGEIGNEIETAYQGVRVSYDIDNANTNELDIIGRIVVINRSFESVVEYESDQYGRNQFGSAQFMPSQGTTDQQLNDDIYRLLIKAKIAKNTNDATLDGIIQALAFIVETDDIMILDNENMSFDIEFGSLTDLERLVLTNFDIVPEPQGVRFNGYIESGSFSQFGGPASQFGRSQFAFKFGA